MRNFAINAYETIDGVFFDKIEMPSFTPVSTLEALPFMYVDMGAGVFYLKAEIMFNYFSDVGIIYVNTLQPLVNFSALYVDNDITGNYLANGTSAYYDKQSLIDCFQIPMPTLSTMPTLNGNGSEFIDGTEVTVDGRTTIYTVTRSYIGLVVDNSYTTLYDLEALNGAKVTVPESLLTQYVAPVIAP